MLRQNNKMKAIIIASGNIIKKEIFDEIYSEGDFIICADGGLNYLDILNVKPNLIVGDFDSVDLSLLEKYKNIETKKYPAEKNYTDMEIAIEEAIICGYNEITIFGATGTRLDHTMANILLIERYLKKNINITIVDNNNYISILNKDIVINKKEGYYVSIVPISECIDGITLKGMKYPLLDVKVDRGSTLCISNEIIANKAEISIRTGVGILFISKDV
jgi:thiamine pyrophosphokinase